MATIEFFSVDGVRVSELGNVVAAQVPVSIPYTGPNHTGQLLYKVTIGKHVTSGAVIGIN